jgi:hypothetical protein
MHWLAFFCLLIFFVQIPQSFGYLSSLLCTSAWFPSTYLPAPFLSPAPARSNLSGARDGGWDMDTPWNRRSTTSCVRPSGEGHRFLPLRNDTIRLFGPYIRCGFLFCEAHFFFYLFFTLGVSGGGDDGVLGGEGKGKGWGVGCVCGWSGCLWMCCVCVCVCVE